MATIDIYVFSITLQSKFPSETTCPKDLLIDTNHVCDVIKLQNVGFCAKYGDDGQFDSLVTDKKLA